MQTRSVFCALAFILLLCAGCAITAANISQKTPRQVFTVSTFKPENLAPRVVGIVEETYPFKYYATSVLPGNNSVSIRSFDMARGGYVLWMELTAIPDATSISIYIPSDLYWNAEETALDLRQRIEQLKP